MGKRRKRTPRQKLEKLLDRAWKTAVKDRDEWTCQHCGKEVSGVNAHASHVVPKSWGKRLRWDMQNGKCMCYHCHLQWFHLNPIEARDWFVEKFPERYEYLMGEKKKGYIKYEISDLEEKLAEF